MRYTIESGNDPAKSDLWRLFDRGEVVALTVALGDQALPRRIAACLNLLDGFTAEQLEWVAASGATVRTAMGSLLESFNATVANSGPEVCDPVTETDMALYIFGGGVEVAKRGQASA